MYDNLILNAHGQADAKDLDHIEQKFHVKIPEAVRKHFLAYNGGYPEKSVFTDKNDDTYIVNHFIRVRKEKERLMEKMLGILRDNDAIPVWLIPFADDAGGNLFCFSVRERDYGSIYYYDHEFEYGENPEEHVVYLAESITAFINSLVDDKEYDGDEES